MQRPHLASLCPGWGWPSPVTLKPQPGQSRLQRNFSRSLRTIRCWPPPLFRRLNSNTQVSAGELNALPFPPLLDDKTLAEIHSLVSDLLNWNGVECTLGNFDWALEREHRLDLLIGSLYGFSSEEVAQIQATMPSHKFVYDPVPEEEDQALLRAIVEVSIGDPDDFVSEADVMATLRGSRDSHGSQISPPVQPRLAKTEEPIPGCPGRTSH